MSTRPAKVAYKLKVGSILIGALHQSFVSYHAFYIQQIQMYILEYSLKSMINHSHSTTITPSAIGPAVGSGAGLTNLSVGYS